MDDEDQIITLPTWNEIRLLATTHTELAEELYAEGEIGIVFGSGGIGKSTIEQQPCQAIGSGIRL